MGILPNRNRMRDSIAFCPYGAKLRLPPVFELVAATVHRTVALDGFESLFDVNKKSHPNGWLFLLAEDEGFEPPQTESESGVLPLH